MPEEKFKDDILSVAERMDSIDEGEIAQLETQIKPEAKTEIFDDSIDQTLERETPQVSAYERLLDRVRSWRSQKSRGDHSQVDHDVSFDTDAILNIEDAEKRVSKLLDLALIKGVHHAVAIAERIDAYTLDRTHDRLADELSEELRNRGMIPEIDQ